MTNVVSFKVKARTRWDRFKTDVRALGLVILFFWHETFGCHDPRVTRNEFKAGRRVLWMECPCGAEWDAIEAGEELGL